MGINGNGLDLFFKISENTHVGVKNEKRIR